MSIPLAIIAMALAQPIGAGAQDAPAPEVCSDGRISRITVDNGPVFVTEPDDPKALRWAMGTANFVHIRTSPSFIRKELLFEEGDCFDPFLVSESRRLLSGYGFLAQAQVEVDDDGDSGDKIVIVSTRDEWSTQFDLGVTYDDGIQLEKLRLTEKNFLGQGIRASLSHTNRRELRVQSFSLSTPRFFGRSNASIAGGTARAGPFFRQSLTHPFIGETSQLSLAEKFTTSTNFFSYATGGAEDYSQVLVPMFTEQFEIAAGTRIGDPGSSWILGVSVMRDIRRMNGDPEFVLNDDFEQTLPGIDDLPASVIRQTGDRSATRVGLHIGTRRYRHEEYVGLDAVRDVQSVGLGYFAGFSVGRSLNLFIPEGATYADDTYANFHASTGIPIGSSIFHAGTTTEAAYSDGEWRDLLTELELVAYARASWLPNQTWFFRASMGGGWRTTMPFQMALGGRDGVRSLRDDEFPGGRRLLLVAENRIKLGWPNWKAVDVGVTVFGDAGRTWKGDAPFGVDSEWLGSVGVGLRVGMPSGTRNVTRPEIIFPVGHNTSPIFRITVELNRLWGGFGPPKLSRSRRFRRGPASF